MTVGIGLGLSNYTFSTAECYWDWVRLCDEEGIDSIWQTDRLVSREPFLECMTALIDLSGRLRYYTVDFFTDVLGFVAPRWR